MEGRSEPLMTKKGRSIAVGRTDRGSKKKMALRTFFTWIQCVTTVLYLRVKYKQNGGTSFSVSTAALFEVRLHNRRRECGGAMT